MLRVTQEAERVVHYLDVGGIPVPEAAGLEGVLAGITGFAGTALMGDGSVLMILNPKELA